MRQLANDKRMMLSMPKEMYKHLQGIARSKRMNVCWIIRELIYREYPMGDAK